MKKLNKIVEAFEGGGRKVLLESQARHPAVSVGGTNLDVLMKMMDEFMAPYDALQRKADSIQEPEGFLEKYAFRLGYWAHGI